jgi:transcriptional regulator with XRE-family HTH domain
MKEKLLQYMNENNLTQKQLASLLHTSESHLSKILNDKKKAGAETYEKYMQLPGIYEEQALRAILNYLMLEFSRGNFSREQLDEVVKPAKNIIDTQKLTPGG